MGLVVQGQIELEGLGTHEEVCSVPHLPGPAWPVHGMRAPRERYGVW